MSRLSCTLEGIRRASELRMAVRLEVKEGGEDLLQTPPESVESLNDTGDSGNDVFVFGLHDPFDPLVNRQLRF